jgi:hypothetical protein
VEAGVAPNAAHGFSSTLPAAATATLLGQGRHVLVRSFLGRYQLGQLDITHLICLAWQPPS